MSKGLFAIILIIVTFLISCKKTGENVDADPLLGNRFGVLIAASTEHVDADKYPIGTLNPMNLSSSVNYVINTLHVKYVRLAVQLDLWTGDNAQEYIDNILFKYKAYANSNIQILLNVNWIKTNDNGDTVFAKADEYAYWLDKVLTKIHEDGLPYPAVVVMQNEESNRSNTTQSDENIQNYIDGLIAGAAVCFEKQVKCANGGFTFRHLAYLTWDWLATTHPDGEQDAFAVKVFPPHIKANIDQHGIPDDVARWKNYIGYYAGSGIDYVNMHWYEPAYIGGWITSEDGIPVEDDIGGGITTVISYLNEKIPGLPIISNELGQLTPSNCVTKLFLNQLNDLNMPMMVWYDGDGLDTRYQAKALRNTNAGGQLSSLRPAGEVFSLRMQGKEITTCN